jgi:hypothetical protein
MDTWPAPIIVSSEKAFNATSSAPQNCSPGIPKVFLGAEEESMDSTVASFLQDVPIPISRKVQPPNLDLQLLQAFP